MAAAHIGTMQRNVTNAKANMMLLNAAGILRGQQEQGNKSLALAGISGRAVKAACNSAKEIAEIGASVEVAIARISHNNTLPFWWLACK